MSVPGNINSAPPPSSFDDDAEFYEESRWAKLKRRLIEEPLIPLGCGLTCWALYEAQDPPYQPITKSMRSGDKYRTNRMFRRRIYAQGFTILAMVLGSVYWESDRAKRKQYDGLVEEKRKKEKQEAWIRELEIREQEEQELRKAREQMIRDKMEQQKTMQETKKSTDAQQNDAGKTSKGGNMGSASSVLESTETRREGPIVAAVRALLERRR